MSPLELSGKNISVQINSNLSLTVFQGQSQILWETSETHTPTFLVRRGNAEPRRLSLADGKASVSVFDDGTYQGYAVSLSEFEAYDVGMELIFAIAPTVDELMIQAAQVDNNSGCRLAVASS